MFLKRFRSILALTIAVVMSASLAVGCTSKTETTTESTTTATEATTTTVTEATTEGTTETTTEAPTTTATEATTVAQTTAPLTGTVSYWSMFTEAEATIQKQAIADFEAANPDCKVVPNWVGRDIRTLVIPAIAAGQQVDVYESDPTVIYPADKTKMKELSDFYTLPSVDTPGKTVGETMLQGLLEWDKSNAAAAGLTGIHSVPYSPYVVAWMYNKALFTKAGITDVPKTWDEFTAVCEKLKAAGIVPITVDDAYLNLIPSMYLQRAIGEPAVAALAAPTKGDNSGWSNPLVLQSLQALQDLHDKGYFSTAIATNKYPAGQAEFATDGAAMYLNGSWLPGEVKDMAGDSFQWGQFAFPEVPNGSGKITENTLGAQAFMVNPDSKQIPATYDLIRYFVSNKTQSAFLANGVIPCINGLDFPAVIQDLKPVVANLTKNVNWASSFTADFATGIAMPEITKVMTGGESAQKALDAIMAANK